MFVTGSKKKTASYYTYYNRIKLINYIYCLKYLSIYLCIHIYKGKVRIIYCEKLFWSKKVFAGSSNSIV